MRAWNEAALTDDEGRLDRPLSARAVWQMPTEVCLREGYLDFWRQASDTTHRRRPPARDLLTKFVGLVSAKDEVIRKFAQLWGPLGLCEHDWPFLHHWQGETRCRPNRIGRPPIADRSKHLLCCEPVTSWRKWAADARDLVNLAAKTHLSQLDREWFSTHSEPDGICTLGWQRNALAKAVNRWVELGNVHIWVTVQHGRFDITLGTSILFSALATQLAFTTIRTKGFAVCVGCGGAFPPTRRTNPNRASYCPPCGRRTALRDAQQRRRLKVRVQKLFRGARITHGGGEATGNGYFNREHVH